jgi:hypothetical protein
VDVDDHRNVAFARALGDQFHNLDRGLGIERGGRLVGEDQIGVLHQGAGDADTLALAAGELVGALVRERAEPDRIEQLKRAVNVLGIEPAQPGSPYCDVAEAAGQHVLDHRQAFHQIIFLEHHADTAADPAQLASVELRDVLAEEQDLAGGRIDQPVDAADQRGFTGTGRTNDRGHAAALDRQRDVLQHRLTRAVFLA